MKFARSAIRYVTQKPLALLGMISIITMTFILFLISASYLNEPNKRQLLKSEIDTSVSITNEFQNQILRLTLEGLKCQNNWPCLEAQNSLQESRLSTDDRSVYRLFLVQDSDFMPFLPLLSSLLNFDGFIIENPLTGKTLEVKNGEYEAGDQRLKIASLFYAKDDTTPMTAKEIISSPIYIAMSGMTPRDMHNKAQEFVNTLYSVHGYRNK